MSTLDCRYGDAILHLREAASDARTHGTHKPGRESEQLKGGEEVLGGLKDRTMSEDG